VSFAVWLTGLSGSGKSTLARELVARLHARGVEAAVLESDVLRTQITPYARYDEAERDMFYEVLADLGAAIVQRARAVIFDATANRRAYREQGRSRIRRFAEVYVSTPLEVCMARDTKGLYRAAREGKAPTLPGVQASYEAPLSPELVISGSRSTPQEAVDEIVAMLERRGWLQK
jgi:adenylylsulfate kinase